MRNAFEGILLLNIMLATAYAYAPLPAIFANPSSGTEPLTSTILLDVIDPDFRPTLPYVIYFDYGRNSSDNDTGTLVRQLGVYTYTTYHTFAAGNYTVRAEVGNSPEIGIDSVAVSVMQYIPPITVSFTASPASGREPLAVVFSGSAVNSNNSLSYTLFYNILNKALNATGPITGVNSVLGSYIYPAGTYTARLSVSNGVAEASVNRTVTASANRPALITFYKAAPLSGTEPLTVVFNGSATDADGDPMTFTIFFNSSNKALNASGPITSRNSVLAMYTYSSGLYWADMRVTDGKKGSVDTVIISVSQKPAPILTKLSATPVSGTEPLTVTFNATVIGNGTMNYSLFFDSGASGSISGTLYNPIGPLSLSHAYPAGIHIANLTVTDGKNRVSQLFPAVNVSAKALPAMLRIISFTAKPWIGREPLTANFSTALLYTGNSSLTYTLIYSLADRKQNMTGPISATTRDLGIHVYSVGNYTPQLIVTDGRYVSTSTIRVNVSG